MVFGPKGHEPSRKIHLNSNSSEPYFCDDEESYAGSIHAEAFPPLPDFLQHDSAVSSFSGGQSQLKGSGKPQLTSGAVPTIGPNFMTEKLGWSALNERAEASSRSSSRPVSSRRGYTSHKMRDARQQQKRTINAERVDSLNLPPPPSQLDNRFTDAVFQFPDPGQIHLGPDSVFEFESDEPALRCATMRSHSSHPQRNAKKCVALPSIQASQKVRRKLDRGDSASSVKSAPPAVISLKDSVHQELIAKAKSSPVLNTHF